MSSLALAFSDIYNQVSEFLGTTNSPAGSDLTKAKDLTYRGYRRFLMPIDLSTGVHHTWSFLKKTTTLSTEDGKWAYELPSDFGSIVVSFTFTSQKTYPNPESRSEEFILRNHSMVDYSGYPQHYAVRTGSYTPATGQKYEVIFYPKPDGIYDYYYTYVVEPEKPTADTDVFVGGIGASEAILQCCLAEVEIQEEEKGGLQEVKANQLIQALIGQDKRKGAKSVGLMYDPSTFPDYQGMQHYVSEVSAYEDE